MSGCFEWQANFRLKEHGFRWSDDQLRQSRLFLTKSRCSATQPVQQNRMLLRIPLEPHTTLVRRLSRRLLQNQAALRLQQVHPSPGFIFCQRGIIKSRILPPKRKFEAPFAVLVPVASPQIAAGLRKDGHHIAAEGDGLVVSGQSSRHS